MIELIAMKQPSKPDVAAASRKDNMPDAKGDTASAPFDQEYQSQGAQQAAEQSNTERSAPEQETATAQKKDTGTSENPPLEAGQESQEKSIEPETSNDIAAVEGPVLKKEVKTRNLSENAFGEQISQTRKLKPDAEPIGSSKENRTIASEKISFSQAASLQQAANTGTPRQVGETAQANLAPLGTSQGQNREMAVSVESVNSAPGVSGDPSPEVSGERTDIKQSAATANAAAPKEMAPEAAVKLAKEVDASKSDERRAPMAMERSEAVPLEGAGRTAPKQSASVQYGPVNPQLNAQVVVAERVDTSSASIDAEAGVSFETRASSTPSSMQQVLNRPETPVMVSRQLAEAMHRFPDRPVEVALNPEELGRVRMSISAIETGITVTVLAERPETLEMMRRHIDQLAREFQAIGYENINFAFNEGQSEQSGDRKEDGARSNTGQPISDEKEDTMHTVNMTVTTGVDVRL